MDIQWRVVHTHLQLNSLWFISLLPKVVWMVFFLLDLFIVKWTFFFGSVLDFVNTLLPYTLQHNPSLSNPELSCFTEVYIFYLGYQLSFSVWFDRFFFPEDFDTHIFYFDYHLISQRQYLNWNHGKCIMKVSYVSESHHHYTDLGYLLQNN